MILVPHSAQRLAQPALNLHAPLAAHITGAKSINGFLFFGLIPQKAGKS